MREVQTRKEADHRSAGMEQKIADAYEVSSGPLNSVCASQMR